MGNSARSDSGPCLQSHVSSSCYSVLDSPLYYSLGFPSGPAHPVSNPPRSSLSLRTWFPAVSPDLHSIFPLCFNIYLGYFIPVSSSESALGFPCSTPRNTEFLKLDNLSALMDLVFVGNPLEEKYSAEGYWIEEATKRLPKVKKLDGNPVI
ncbi:unnamed protein product [Coregonus sp. 'balchen']|nr:unnamed protein product [Coregonus sp. 'balchen']